MLWLLVRIVRGVSSGVEDTREIPKCCKSDEKMIENGDVSSGNDIHGKAPTLPKMKCMKFGLFTNLISENVPATSKNLKFAKDV